MVSAGVQLPCPIIRIAISSREAMCGGIYLTLSLHSTPILLQNYTPTNETPINYAFSVSRTQHEFL
jgi:hypothetical protein